MTVEERIIDTLRRFPGQDDDQLEKLAAVHPRQQVNQICHRLEAEGKLRRTNGPEGKIINTLVGGNRTRSPAA